MRAFTGADSRRIGRFEQTYGGTIFLDEIGDLTPGTQVKLLRVLQEKTIQRLGGRETIPVDARVIAATHRDLEREIETAKFREDLLCRLNVVTITVPPLRQRAEDIPALIHYFLRRHSPELGIEAPPIDPTAVEYLAAQPWIGNVRELGNAVRKALLLARELPITVETARAATSGKRRRALPANALTGYVGELLAGARANELENAHAVLIQSAERELFTQAIKLATGNQTLAARWLGISRLTMREKLLAFGLHPSQKPSSESGEPDAGSS